MTVDDLKEEILIELEFMETVYDCSFPACNT
jgi:hypothetical protein